MTVSSLPESKYTMPDVARILNVSRPYVYAMWHKGELHAERDESNQLRVSRDEVAWLLRNRESN